MLGVLVQRKEFFSQGADSVCPKTRPTVIEYSKSRAESGQALVVIQRCATDLLRIIQIQKQFKFTTGRGQLYPY